MKYKTIIFLSLVGLLFSCKPEIDEFEASAGSADFSNYVSLGNSLTAGYADGALYNSSQASSYPSILAQQFSTVGGGNFVQPLVNSEYGVLPGKKKLGYSTDCIGVTSLGLVDDIGDLDPVVPPLGYNVNNLGVPGAKSFHLLAPGYGNPAYIELGLANPYFVRFAQNGETSSVLTDAVAMSPTFFSLWIGNNDVLGYAADGGQGDWITMGDTVAGSINGILQTMTEVVGAKGVIANLPDIMTAPYFTYMGTKIPYNGLVLTRQGQVDSLNFAYQALGITFELGQNPFIVEDAATGLPRKMLDTDIFLLTLPTDSIKCYGYGSAISIPHKYILDANEISNVNNAVAEYNGIIGNLATTYNLAFVDINKYFKDVAESGVTQDGESLTIEFITGGIFSLDGIHLSKKGYALIANQFIMAINEKYGANVPQVSVVDYPGIEFP